MPETINCDVAIAGGGLAGGLIALALAERRPALDVRLIEPGARLGGNHIWSFFDSDVAPDHRWLVEPLICHHWDGYEVAFPAHQRSLEAGYNSIASERLDAVVRGRLKPGQIVAAKLRLVGAADAAAYSAALWQARALNFQAYMNRGIVANEVAIAQLVSLRSWSDYMNQALHETAVIGTVAPPLGASMRSLAQGWATMNDGLQRALPPLEAAASRWNVEVLSRAEFIANLQAPAMAGRLARDVAIANVPGLESSGSNRVFAVANAGRWRALSDDHGRSGEQRSRLREVVMSSRDGFTQARDWTIGLPPLLSLKKRGGTDLIGYESWRGMDTAAINVHAPFFTHEQPVAWGEAENRRRPMLAHGDHGGSYRDNPRTSGIAAAEIMPANGYAGLPAYRDIRIGRADPGSPLRYEVELQQAAVTIATSDVIMGASSTFVPGEEPKVFSPAFHSGSAYALAAAQVYFRRPVGRADHRQELANLFNPYWQARLAPVTRAQRLLAAAARGGAPDPYVVLP